MKRVFFVLRMLFVGCAILSGSTILSSCASVPSNKPNQEFIEEDELSIISLVDEATEFSEKGRYIDAELKLWQALEIAPKEQNRPIRIILAQVLGKQKLYKQAEEIFEQLLKESPNSRNILIAWARYLEEKEETVESEKVFQRLADTTEKRIDWGLRLRNKKEYQREMQRNIYTPTQIAQYYRNISVLQFRDWRVDDALCSSSQAYHYSAVPLQLARHARLLNAFGYFERARNMISPPEVPLALNNPPELLFEYAMASVAIGEEQSATRTCKAVLSKKEVPPELSIPCQWIAAYRHILKEKKAAERENQPEEGEGEEVSEDAQKDTQKTSSTKTLDLRFREKEPKTEEEIEEAEEKKKEEILALSELEVDTNPSRMYWPLRFLEIVEELEARQEEIEES